MYAQAAWFAVACKRTFGLSIAAMQVSLGHSNLQGLLARFLWNMLVCTAAKLGGPHSGQAAYEELMLMALVHLVHLQLLVWFCGDQRHCLRITCNVACPP